MRTPERHPDYWSELPGTEPERELIDPLPPPRVLDERVGADGPLAEEWGDEPCYVISIAARMVGMHVQTLRYYERAGLVTPPRTKGNIRLYRRSDIDRLRLIQRLIAQHGVNLAGVDMILRMEERIQALRDQVQTLENELERRKAGGEP
jgi:MerR family transcriptional regulator/heat shock protein HspR